MKKCFTTSKSANRFNDWCAYQKSGIGVGSTSWKDLQRPLNEVTPDFASPSYSPLPTLTFWQKIKNFFRKIFQFFKR